MFKKLQNVEGNKTLCLRTFHMKGLDSGFDFNRDVSIGKTMDKLLSSSLRLVDLVV